MNMLLRTAMVVGLCGLHAAALAQEVHFSRLGGTFIDPFLLSLSASSSNAIIHYELVTNAAQASATQTNVPTESSAVYTTPISISVSTLVRAREFEPGRPPGPPVSEAFIQISPELAGFSSDLPLVVVHNWGPGQAFPGTSLAEEASVVATFDTEAGRSSLTGEAGLISRVGIHDPTEEEGNQPKQNMVVKFWDEFNQPAVQPLLGMPAGADWLFWGINGFDPGMMHNAIFHWIGRQTGRYSSRTRYVEVFVKRTAGPVTSNDYRGLFLVEEIPKRSSHRVDITALEPEDTNAPAVSGGYLLRIGRTTSTDRTFFVPAVPGVLGSYSNLYGGQTIILDDPTGLDLFNDPRRANQLHYIRDYFTNFIRTLAGPNFTDPFIGYSGYIDVDSWIDHHLVNTICYNVDAFRLHSYLFKEREKKIELGPPWDCDRCLGAGGPPNNDNRAFNPRQWRRPTTGIGVDNGTDFFGRSLVGVNWWDRLFRDPDFWQRWIDRYQALRANQFANDVVVAAVDGFYDEIKEAQVRDQLRWGGLWNGVQQNFTYPRSGNVASDGYSYNFGSADNFGRGRFTNEVNFQKKWLMDRLDFMDTNFLAMPVLVRTSGPVPEGTVVVVSSATRPGTLTLYTLDGTDPRLPGGAVSPAARTNVGDFGIVISNNVGLVARSYNTNHANLTNILASPTAFEVGKPHLNSFWSGPASAIYYTAVPLLRITEVMYHASGGDAYDFIEVKNVGTLPLNLARFRLRGDVQFDFPEFILNSGQHCVVVASLVDFQTRYGLGALVAGAYSGSLPDDDGHIVLQGSVGELILDFSYRDEWRPITDGFGFSLVAVDENAPPAEWNLATRWHSSGVPNGTPGALDPGPLALPAIYINETLTHTDSPVGDAVELYNASGEPANVGGWFLTDDLTAPRKYRIPDGTTIPARGFLAFQQADSFGAGPNPFDFDARGDAAYLFSADAAGNLTGWLHGFAFGAQASGVTFGRHLISTGEEHFVAQRAPTLGAANSGPLVGPVAISEINYYPPNLQARFRTVDNSVDEFIELQNVSAAPAPLHDLSNPASTWQLRGVVSFAFPPGTVIPPGGFVLVVGFNPVDTDTLENFRAVNNVPPGTPIFGPWTGRLDNTQGTVELVQPDPPGAAAGSTQYVVADRVAYQSIAPWPLGAAATGASITRIEPNAYGNDPVNWRAGLRTPGALNPGGALPVIVTDPVDTTGIEASSASFTVAAAGTMPLGYQWFFNGTAIPGAVNPMLSLTDLQLNQAGTYACVVFAPGGAVQSSGANLTVLKIARISGHPQPVTLRGSAAAADYGFTTNHATFRIAVASGTGETRFQWRFNGVPISGATTTTLVVSNVKLSNDGLYDVAITDDVTTVFSRTARLKVLVNPAIRVPPPAQTEVVTGATFTVSASASGHPLPFGFEWRQGSIPRQSNTVFATSDFATLTAPASLVTNQTWRLVVRNEAAPGTSGSTALYTFFVTTLADSDGDGIPDKWENSFGFNPTNNVDRNLDSDGDGLSNWAEYIAGTDPTNALSYLRIEAPELAGEGVLLHFFALANQTYAVEASDVVTGPWNRFAEIVSVPTNRVVTISDPLPRVSHRVYRLVTPQGD